MAKAKGSKSTKQGNTGRKDLESQLNYSADRLAGVSEVLRLMGENSKDADSLALIREVVDRINENLSALALNVGMGARHG